MKKLISIFAIVATLFVASCNPKPVSVVNQAKADLAVALTEAPDTLVAFYEIEMTLDNPVSVLRNEKVNLLMAKTVIQEGPVVKFIDRTYNAKGKIVEEVAHTEEGWWFGDTKMALDSIALDLNDAMEALKKADIILPEADKVTLRRPLAPPFEYYYIFGTYGTSFIAVNARTGEVEGVEATENAVLKKNEEEAAE